MYNILVGGLLNLGDAVGSEPRLDGSNILLSGSSILGNLFLRQPLAVVAAVGVGDIEELLLETLDVVLLKTNLGLDHGTLVSLTLCSPVDWQVLDLAESDERAMFSGSSKRTDGSGGSEANLGEGNHCEGRFVVIE